MITGQINLMAPCIIYQKVFICSLSWKSTWTILIINAEFLQKLSTYKCFFRKKSKKSMSSSLFWKMWILPTCPGHSHWSSSFKSKGFIVIELQKQIWLTDVVYHSNRKHILIFLEYYDGKNSSFVEFFFLRNVD